MVVAYISELHSKMATTITQNQRLLNGMHEGLLILSNSTDSRATTTDQVIFQPRVMFCNSQAKKLTSAYLEERRVSSTNDEIEGM